MDCSKTSAARVAKHRANKKIEQENEKIRLQITALEAQLALISGPKKFKSPRFAEIRVLWNTLNPEGQCSEEKFGANIISTADKAVNQNWSFGGKVSSEDEIGIIEGGLNAIGSINGSPADQGPRFNTPSWVSDRKQLDEFERRLIQHRVEKLPLTRVEGNELIVDEEDNLDQIKINCYKDSYLLERYFVERRDLDDFFLETPEVDKRKSEPKNKSKHFLPHPDNP
jgi:hypothetical protein